MLIVQKFHSIHEIDPEFISALELLLQEEVPHFSSLIEQHDTAPAGDVFTYFLFFGPTQNAPIGMAQLCLRSLPGKDLVSWQKKVFTFWKKDHLSWKQLTWKLVDGNPGLCVYDPRFARSIKEKILEIIKEYESRPEIMTQEIFHLKDTQNYHSTWDCENKWSKDLYVLGPLTKSFKNYQEYLASLSPEIRNSIKQEWKNLHLKREVELGDYATIKEIPEVLLQNKDILNLVHKKNSQILIFKKEDTILGCITIDQGTNGNIFFSPYPLEPQGSESIVSDDLYIQYSLFKFFEMPEAKKCHILKNETKIVFDEKEDLLFFQEQGFEFRTISQSFASKLPGLFKPI